MSTLIQSFLSDFAANDRALRAMGYEPGSQRLARLIDEAALDTNHVWIEAAPANNDHQTLREQIGVVVSCYRDGTINRPRGLRKVGAEFWVVNHYRPVGRFDSNWSYLGDWGRYGDPNADAANTRYLYDIAVDEVGGRVYTFGDNRVSCFDLDTAAHVWTWGDGTSGNYADDRPNSYGGSCELLPNGNLAVAVRYGRGTIGGQEGLANGYVAELDAATGNPVACRLMKRTNGAPWRGEVSEPTRIRLLDGRLYVSCYNTHLIGVFDPDTWEHIETFTRPAGIDVQSVNPRGLCLNDAGDAVVVAANGPKVLVALGLSDHDYRWHSGEAGWDDRTAAENQPGELYDIYDILPIGGGRYAVADSGNNRISVLPEFNYYPVPYQYALPAGYRLVDAALPEDFDPDTGTRLVRIKDLDQVGPLYLACEREAQ